MISNKDAPIFDWYFFNNKRLIRYHEYFSPYEDIINEDLKHFAFILDINAAKSELIKCLAEKGN